MTCQRADAEDACAACYPNLVGRRMINVRFTDMPKELFPPNSEAVGYEYAEGHPHLRRPLKTLRK